MLESCWENFHGTVPCRVLCALLEVQLSVMRTSSDYSPGLCLWVVMLGLPAPLVWEWVGLQYTFEDFANSDPVRWLMQVSYINVDITEG